MATATDIRPANVQAATDELPAALIAMRSKADIVAQLESLKPPVFIHSYPSRLNPNASKAVASSLAWFNDQSLKGVFTDPKRTEQFLMSKIHDLVTSIYSDAEEEELSWLCCYMMYIYLLDDVMDERGYFRSPEKSAPIFLELNLLMMWSFPDNTLLQKSFVELINLFPEDHRQAIFDTVDAKLASARLQPGSVYDFSNSVPLIASYGDLWVKLLSSTPSDTVIRWAHSQQGFLIANVIEAKIRNGGAVPSVSEYIALRRHSSGVDPCILVAEFADKLSTSLTWELFDSAQMTAFRLAITDIVAWQNDLYSFKKETFKNGDYINLVWVISLESGCSLADAQALGLEMLHNRVEDMERAITNLESISTPDTRLGVSAFVKTARNWVSGVQKFTLETARYSWEE